MVTIEKPKEVAIHPNKAQTDEVLKVRLGRKYSREQEDVLYCTKREILAMGGERAGKSFVTADYCLARYWLNQLVWIAGDDYESTKPEFTYIAEGLEALGVKPTVRWHNTDMSLITYSLWFPGDIGRKDYVIKTKSLLKWLKVASEAPDLVLFVEAGRGTHQQYQRLADRTAEKRATLLASGTCENSLGWYPEKWKQGQAYDYEGTSDLRSFSLPSWSNLHVFPGGREDEEIQRLEKKHSADYFMERFGAVPSPPKGLVFKEFRNHIHVKKLEIVRGVPIELAIDPGYAGAYAVLAIQVIDDQPRVVREVYLREVVTEDVIRICMNKPWWRLVEFGVADIAAKQHQAMPAVAEVWREKAGVRLVMNLVKEEEGRERLHTFLKPDPITQEPPLLIDEGCKGLISEFGGGPSPFSDVMGEQVYEPYKWKVGPSGEVIGKSPEDKNNHAIKALSYWLIEKYGHVKRDRGRLGRTVSSCPF